MKGPLLSLMFRTHAEMRGNGISSEMGIIIVKAVIFRPKKTDANIL